MPRWLRTLCACLRPRWAENGQPDPTHPHRRRLTRVYRRKQGLVKNLWIGSGCLMLLNPVLPFVMLVGLITTLFSFVILDETA